MTATAKTLLDYPKGVAKLVQTLAQLRADGYDAAHYNTLSALLAQHLNHVKFSARKARELGLVVIDVGGGKGKLSAVRLTEAGAALVAVPTASGPRS